jgi:polysaccharide export outer membrane protein
MTGTVYVGDDGTVNLPLVGSVKVAGVTPVQASRRIEKALKDGQFLVDPHVTVTLVQSHSQKVSVVGEVRLPGRYSIEANTSLVDLLAQAGGTTENSATTVYVVHMDAQGNSTRRAVDLNAFAGPGKGALPTEILHGGDQVFVPRAETFSIYGEITRPSEYRIEPGMTVIEAIALAGGVTTRGSERRVEINRKGPDGQYVTTRAKPGDLVQAGDVIRVKERIF